MTRKIFGLTGGDWFFAFQIAMAYFFAIPQVLRMREDTRGVTITWLLFAGIFVFLNLWLALETHRKLRHKETLQTLCIYANWAVLVTPMVIISLYKCVWTEQDSLISALIAVSAAAVLLWCWWQGRTLTDPAVRGMFAGLFRMVPHLYLSYVIVLAGSAAGIAGKTLWAGNITASARIITLIKSGRKSGWDRGIKASLISEFANEGSWLLVTAFWLFYR